MTYVAKIFIRVLIMNIPTHKRLWANTGVYVVSLSMMLAQHYTNNCFTNRVSWGQTMDTYKWMAKNPVKH